MTKEAGLHLRVRIHAISLAALLLAAAMPALAAQISIVSPVSNQTIHSNQGKLAVEVSRAGAPPGARTRLVLDGAARPGTNRGNVIELDGINRGSHRLQAVLLDARGKQIAASAPVTFYMWHASRLFPSRK